MRRFMGRLLHKAFIAILWRTTGEGPVELADGKRVKVIGITREETPAGWIFTITCAERGAVIGGTAGRGYRQIYKIDFREFKKVKGIWKQQPKSE